jgi:hypothetical protein
VRFRIAAAAACISVLLTVEALAAQPVFVSDCIHGRVRPTEVVLFCGDAGAYVMDIHWRHWGGSIAVGSGVYTEKTCVPDCATGGVRRRHATLWLGDVGRCPRQGSKRYYRRVKVSGVHLRFARLCP